MEENEQILLMNQKIEELEDRLRSIAVSDLGELRKEFELFKSELQPYQRFFQRINSWIRPVTPKRLRAWIAR